MYRNIHDSFWTDPEVKNYSALAKLLYLYLITNPYSHYSGVYFIYVGQIAKDTGIDERGVQKLLEFLEAEGKAKYDHEYECVFVTNMLKYQFITNEKNLIKGVHNHFKTLHGCPLINEFASEYPHYKIERVDVRQPVAPEPEAPLPPAEKPTIKSNYIEEVRSVVDYLNLRAKKNFRIGSQATRKWIIARLNDGFRVEDFYKVIDKKVTAWAGDPKMSAYIRPETLFGNKFEGYLNEGDSRFIAKPQPAIDRVIAMHDDVPDFTDI